MTVGVHVRSPLKRLAPALVGGALALSLLAHPAAGEASEPAAPAPTTRAASVLPTPQQVIDRPGTIILPGSVVVVAGAAVDGPALASLTDLLDEFGITIHRASAMPGGVSAPVIVLGGPEETPASVDELRSLGADGPDGLPAEGYVLTAGRNGAGRPRIVLSGVDGAGTFYAVQSLRQLLRPHAGGARLGATELRDWPGYKVRGGMESFYGPVWSQADRRSQIEFLARHKMNQYFYGPADDQRTGGDWSSPYGADELARMKGIVDLARARHVDFVYRISPEAPVAPSNGICHSRRSDREELVARFEQLWDIGVRSFVIAWDDVAGRFVCAEDDAAYGEDASPIAAAQAEVTNYVQHEFVETHPGASRLVTVPTEYWGMNASAYKSRFDELLSTQVDLYWTGPAVVSPTISTGDLAALQEVYPRHRVMLWDNYPVNDYATNRLLLGPVVNRDPALAEHVVGISFNELVQRQEASQIPLGTEADYAWNPAAYDPARSWTRTLQILGGDAYEELRLFAENNRSSILDPTERPEIAALVDRLVTAYSTGRPVRALLAEVDHEMQRLEDLPQDLRAELDNPRMLSQIEPWLDRIGTTGSAARAALRILDAQDRGDGEAAWRARRDQATDRGELDRTPQQIAPGPIDRLLTFAATQNDGYIGDRWYGDVGTATGTPAAAGSSLADLTDRRDDTAYVAARAPLEGDGVEVPITAPHRLSAVTVVQDPDAPTDGTVEARVGGDWIGLGKLDGGFTELPAGKVSASAVRIRWTPGSTTPRVYEVVPHYADVLSGTTSMVPSGSLVAPGATKRFDLVVEAHDEGTLTGRVSTTGPEGWTIDPADRSVRVRAGGRTVVQQVPVDVTVPAGTRPGRYEVVVSFATEDTPTRTHRLHILVGTETYPGLVTGADPVGYWRLGDPPDSTSAVDSASDGQDGAYVSGAQPGAAGVLPDDTAADLTSGYVEASRTDRTNLTGPFTLEAWVKLNTVAPSPGQAIIESYTGPAVNGYALRVDNGRLQAWSLGAPGGGFGLVTGRTALETGRWHHVAAVFDGTSLTVYLDGASDGSVATTVAPGSGTASIKLGARGDDAGQRLQGDLDEVAIYDRALSAQEIEDHFLAGS